MTRQIVVLATALLTIFGCMGQSALSRHSQKLRLIQEIQHQLLQSVAHEKSAVLATTDAESQAFAKDAQRASAEIGQRLGELEQLVAADGLAAETDKLRQFQRVWAEFQSIDERLLALAVVNSNLKATRLASAEGAAALDRLVTALGELQTSTSDPGVLRALSQMQVGALQIQALLSVHIPSADDAEMTRLEELIATLSAKLDQQLERTEPQLNVAGARQAWGEYRRLIAEVVRLSRQNTNVISFDVSVHEKRRVTEQCLSALAELLAAVEAAPHATR